MLILYFFLSIFLFFFFFNDTATTEIYTLSLHDALPILAVVDRTPFNRHSSSRDFSFTSDDDRQDRKSTRLNSSHVKISYAVFCLKKKKKTNTKKNKKKTTQKKKKNK